MRCNINHTTESENEKENKRKKKFYFIFHNAIMKMNEHVLVFLLSTRNVVK